MLKTDHVNNSETSDHEFKMGLVVADTARVRP